MEIIVDQRSTPSMRAKALRTLRRVPSRYLRKNDTIEQLISVYDGLHDRQEKIDLIFLVGASPPRALPFLTKILDDEQDKAVREQAAAGLAAWNVRRGVAELIRVLEECQAEHAWGKPACKEAGKAFQILNPLKGWGFPHEEIRKSIEARSGLDEDEVRALYVAEIKKWFAENKQRFPDWKPGDPLPETPPAKPDKRAGE